MLGICGGGYSWAAAKTEKRFKAVVSSTGVNYGRMMRDTVAAQGGAVEALRGIAAQRTAEVRGTESLVNGMLPPTAEAAEQVGDIDIIEAYDYYRTGRGEHPNGCVLFEAAHGASAIGFDAFHLAELLLDQPLLVVVGDKQGAFGAYRDGHEIYERAASAEKQLLVLEGVSHYEIYDQPKGAGKAIEAAIPFFEKHLGK